MLIIGGFFITALLFLLTVIYTRLFIVGKSVLGRLENLCGCTNHISFTNHPYLFSLLILVGLIATIFVVILLFRILQFKKNTKKEINDFRQGVKEEAKEAREIVKDKRQEYTERLRNAQTDEERDAIRAEIEADKEKFKELKEKRIRELQEKRKDYLKRKLDIIEKRLAAYINKFEQIHDRIAERVKILEDKGYDMSVARELNAKVKEYLNAALQDLKDFQELVQNSLTVGTTDELKEILAEARKELKSAKENVRSAHRAIREVIKKIKEIIRNNNSSTTTVTPVSVEPVVDSVTQ